MRNPFSPHSEMGIGKRVCFLLVVFFVPLLLLQGFTFYRWSREAVEVEIRANLDLARTVAKTFESFINDVLHTQFALGLAATASPPPTPDSLKRILQGVEEKNPVLRSLTWSDPEGVELVSTNTAVKSPSIRVQVLVPRILSGEEYGVSDLHDSPNTGEKVFVIGRGIRDVDGRLQGIVSCVCNPERLDPVLAVQRSKDTAISLVDSKGIHVYRYPSNGHTPAGVDRLERQPIIRQALDGKETAAEARGPLGETRLAAFAPIRSIGWVAASSRARDEVIESTLHTLLPDMVLMLLVTLAAFGAAVILSRPISAAIHRLQDHAAALGQGQPGVFEIVLGPREIKSLSETFREMAEKVRSREKALLESEKNARLHVAEIEAIYRSAHVGLCIIDRDFRYVRVNERLAEMNGISVEENAGKTIREVVPDLADTAERLAERVFRTGEAILNIELSGTTGNRPGVERHFIQHWIPFKDDSGEVIGINVAVNEITDQKRMEEELRRSRDELEIRVEERTAELERKNQDLQELTFVASHDLSEPLRKIQTFASLLETKKANILDEESGIYVARMKESANRMQDLLEGLLKYLLVEIKGGEFKRTRLHNVVSEVVRDLEPMIRKVGARVEIRPLPVVVGDPGQLRQLFWNLITNSLKYRRRTALTEVKIGGEMEGGSFRITVEDNGIGFDEKYLEKIFLPFQRLHGKYEYSGIGIGLAICKKIVDRHRGTLIAKSDPGKGTTFIVTLPAPNRKANGEPKPSAP
ncbi:MAG: PAS domain S-box protein [Desulfobacteraceae bacterium]|nr:MAG: PAS domain S-box protein [Desulfobacteraceae bacterium]